MRYKTRCNSCGSKFCLNDDSPAFIGFPVNVLCPHCKAGNLFESRHRHPKVAPDDTADPDGTILAPTSTLANLPEINDTQEPPVEQLNDRLNEMIGPEVSTGNTADHVIPFWELANQLGQNVRDSIKKAAAIKVEIDNFTKYVTNYFESQWKYSTQFARCWRPEYLQEFLSFPFVAVPVKCDDPIAEAFSRWVISPKFFEPQFGYRIQSAGGFRLELVNQYSRLHYRFDSAIAVKLNVPDYLDLQIRGSKIIGSSLRYCWKDIPGTLTDMDHSETMPSIYIRNPAKAKVWLARNGVPPQESRPLMSEEFLAADYEQDIMTDFSNKQHLLDAWTVFIKHGRVALYWDNAIEARRFAWLAAMYMRGVVPIFTADEETIGAWKMLYSIPQHEDKSVLYTKANKFVYCLNGQQPIWTALMKCKLVIVDCFKEIDPDVIDKLLAYDGRLILLGDDPLFDFQTTNVQAPKYHALAPFQVQEYTPDEIWETKILNAKYSPDIQASILKMTHSKIVTD